MASPRQDGMPRNIKSRVFFNILIFSIFEKDQRWSNCSRLSFKNIDRDQIALVDLLKRSTVIESFCWSFKQSSKANLLLIFEKDWQKRMLSKTKPFAPKNIRSAQHVWAFTNISTKSFIIEATASERSCLWSVSHRPYNFHLGGIS